MHGPYLVIPVTKKQSNMGLELVILRKSTFYDRIDEYSLLNKFNLGYISLVETVLKGDWTSIS